jgi:malonyl-CoA/methylmalonyl-CoA synthetase
MDSNSLRGYIGKSVEKWEEKPAIKFIREGKTESEISFGDLDRNSNSLAHFFLDLGVEKGDRIILYFPKSLIFVVAYLSLLKIGAVAVPLNPGFKKSELEYLLTDSKARLVLIEADKQELVRDINPEQEVFVMDTKIPYEINPFFCSFLDSPPVIEIQMDDPGLIIYTSGTTGNPKGVILSHGNLIHDANNIINIWEISESDVLCHALPLFHIHGLCFALNTALLAGARILMLDQFSPNVVIETLASNTGEDICTMFMAVPAMYQKMMEHIGRKKMDFDHIRLWTSGSAPLVGSDFDRIKEIFGKEPVEREGMSETGMNFSNPIKGKRKRGSIGIPLPNLEVRIVDPNTKKDVQKGQKGEFWLRGPSITSSYWQKPRETEEVFHQGWFKTGDCGFVDNEGYYYLTDRIKHIIISGGENISPKEIEMVINRYDDVAESSVVGLPDERWGEIVAAAVVIKSGHTVNPIDIKKFCKQNLHDWKCPKKIAIVKDLPRNTMGKVLKEEIQTFF